MAAFFIDARAERSTVCSYFLTSFVGQSRDVEHPCLESRGSDEERKGEKEDFGRSRETRLFDASEAPSFRKSTRRASHGLERRAPLSRSLPYPLPKEKEGGRKKREKSRLPLATRNGVGLGYKAFPPFSLRAAIDSVDALSDGPEAVEARGGTSARRSAKSLRELARRTRSIGNDPSAGSPTETLLRLLLPLNDHAWALSRQAHPSNHPEERPSRQMPVQIPRKIVRSVVATGGVYKGQGRNRRELMTRAYWEFLVQGR